MSTAGTGMKTMISRRLGELTFQDSDVIIFEKGLLGFAENQEYLLVSHEETEPIQWLISIDGGPELPVIRLDLVGKDVAEAGGGIGKATLRTVEAQHPVSVSAVLFISAV